MSDFEKELKTVNAELRNIQSELRRLKEREEELKKRKEFLTDSLLLLKSKEAGEGGKWESSDFPWHSKLKETLKNIFKLSSFRANQLSAINATLSKRDTILIMPTGGGKSLCYQLPALIDKGYTLVISPMLSLIEDQVMQLKSLSVKAEMFSASISTEVATNVQKMMIDTKSGLKLLYVTPEKLAKSKRFMSKLQKSHSLGMLSRIAVDEVHCCSQWGHDFRTDYQFLSVLKGMFPDVPMIGLTATATTKVILDVQKMLSIQGCLLFKSSFNRPNLFYEVREKPSAQKECIDQLEDLLKRRFKNMSGIIYATSVKDCEDLRQELRNRGCRVSGYHAQLEPELRSKVHKKWLSGEYQAVVATIAFGLGIDKPDVRFVIHHSLSKSMENFYQESGRAGRDGNPANCILFYRFADIFKLTTMVFATKTGLHNLYSIVDYCLNPIDCRRKTIASHFDETWESTDCNKMCDNCSERRETEERNIVEQCRAVFKILDHANSNDIKLTGPMVIDAWFGKSSKIQSKLVKPPMFSADFASNILAYLLIKNYLKIDFHFTPYSTISYLNKGAKAGEVNERHKIMMMIRGKKITSLAHNSSNELKSKRRLNDDTDTVPGKIMKIITLEDSENE